jgi:hypothetical protein
MALMAETETETASDGRNVVLERLLARAGWTPEGLGDRLNQLAATLGLRAHVNRRSTRRWIYPEASRTAARRPREPWPALICHLLHERLGVPVSPESLGWTTTGPLRYVPADDELDQPWNSVGAVASLATVIDADAVERRHFLALTGLTLTSAAHQWLIDPARVAASLLGKRADHALVDELERVADARRRMDDALGGGTLLRTVNEDLRVVVGLLKNASYTEEVGRRLYAVAAQFGRVAGWIACDCEQPALAQRYFLAALRAAHVSGDRALGADVLGFMSIQAAQSDSPRDAVTLAESALAHEKMLTPGVAAMLHGRLAVGAAYAGDEMVSRRAQKRVIDLTSRSTRDEEPPWIYWYTDANSRGDVGRSLLRLGRPTEAEPHLRTTLSLIDPAFIRDRAAWQCDLATAQVGSRSVERACKTAGEAAAAIRRLDSADTRRMLVRFREAAEPYATSTAVREFDAKHGDLIVAAPGGTAWRT